MKHTIILLLLLLAGTLWSAVGCDLNDPDRDVRRLFPGSTGYKTTYRSLQREGGASLLAGIEKKLGDKFSGMYETIDVPYSLYEVFSGKNRIGWIHGVNQKGRYGGIQVFLVLDTKGVITDLYFQKLSSKNARLYKDKAFTRQFVGLSLNDFMQINIVSGKGQGKAANIKDPTAGKDTDFLAILRGVKKNLVLMEHFSK
jgi:hypothetical protein